MSEDRFKQARRNLYDKHNQRQQDTGFSDFDDEATALVNTNALNPGQQGAPSLPFSSNPPSLPGAGSLPTPAGAYPNNPIQQHNRTPGMMIGDGFDEGFGEENTAFVSLPDVQNMPSPHANPMGDFGGEATDFVNINDIQMDLGGGGNPILQDSVLTQSYQFGPESIQDLSSTLIFAQNVNGQSVILKRIWTEDASTFPQEIRDRVALIDSIRHPNLVSLNGMIATPSGVWIELTRPPGYRLSDIITQNGPQETGVVFEWLSGVGDALDEIHKQGYVHAGLTPDAIWVQSEGGVMLEPFDILAFEDRGDLAPYGPREMSYAPDQRELTPATDTFCLANIAFISLTGLPIDLSKAGEVEPKVSKAFQRALSANPRERFQKAADFLKPFRTAASTKKGLPDLNFKYLVIGVGVLLIAVVGFLYLNQQNAAEAARKAAIANALPTPFEVPEDGPDPRIKIQLDLKNDPVTLNGLKTLDKAAKQQAEQARIDAREDLDGVSSLISSQRKEKYNASLGAITRAIRLSGESEDDTLFLKDLRKRKDVIAIRKGYFRRINGALEKEKAGSARLLYTNFAAIEPTAPALTFFNKNKTAEVKQLISIVPPEEDE